MNARLRSFYSERAGKYQKSIAYADRAAFERNLIKELREDAPLDRRLVDGGELGLLLMEPGGPDSSFRWRFCWFTSVVGSFVKGEI